eukprot:9436330-Pyramimonas_sp.AAC.1
MISVSPIWTRPGDREGDRDRAPPLCNLIRLWHFGHDGLCWSNLSLYSHAPQPRQRVHGRGPMLRINSGFRQHAARCCWQERGEVPQAPRAGTRVGPKSAHLPGAPVRA